VFGGFFNLLLLRVFGFIYLLFEIIFSDDIRTRNVIFNTENLNDFDFVASFTVKTEVHFEKTFAGRPARRKKVTFCQILFECLHEDASKKTSRGRS